MSKLKEFFSGEIKEKIITEDGKRNLYFDRQRKEFIKFRLESKTTCTIIYKLHKKEIQNKLIEIYGQNVDEEKFAFFVVELLSNKSDQKPSLIDLKIGMDETLLFGVLQNCRLMLCYLPYNNQNNNNNSNLRKQCIKSLTPFNPLVNDIYRNDEAISYQGKKESEYEIYLPKTIIHYYNEENQSFSKEKIKISEKEISIYAKKNRNIFVKEIKKWTIFINGRTTDGEKIIDKYTIKYDIPKFCIEIITEKEKLLIGRNTPEHFITLKNAIQQVGQNNKNWNNNSFLNGKIMEEINSLSTTHKIISQSCFTINDFITNKEKRKILFKDFKEKPLADIVNNIMEYKSNFKKRKFNAALKNVKNLLDIMKEITTKEELNKYEKIITKQKIEFLEDINYKIEKIREIGNGSIYGDDSQIVELTKLLNIYMFDYIYYEIRDEYILKYYEENFINNDNDNSTTKLKENVKLLLGNYFTNAFNFKKEEDFGYLGDDKVEQIIKDENDRIFYDRKILYYVLKQK